MNAIKHYGTADLYDPDRPSGEASGASKIDAVALGRNVRAWMKNRMRSRTGKEMSPQNISTTKSKTPPETLAKSASQDSNNSPSGTNTIPIGESQTLPTSIPSPSKNPSKASFSSLPGEIRNTIYAHSLFPHHHSLLAFNYSSPRDIFRTLLRSPLFRVSRQVRAEALSFLAATKDFRIPGIRTATTFLKYMGPVGRVSLANMTIAFLSVSGMNMEDGKELIRLLGEVRGPGVKKVTIGVQSQYEMDEAAWTFLKHMREALLDGCEDMDVRWCVLANNVVEDNEQVRELVEKMEWVFEKGTRVEGSIWALVAAKHV